MLSLRTMLWLTSISQQQVMQWRKIPLWCYNCFTRSSN